MLSRLGIQAYLSIFLSNDTSLVALFSSVPRTVLHLLTEMALKTTPTDPKSFLSLRHLFLLEVCALDSVLYLSLTILAHILHHAG